MLLKMIKSSHNTYTGYDIVFLYPDSDIVTSSRKGNNVYIFLYTTKVIHVECLFDCYAQIIHLTFFLGKVYVCIYVLRKSPCISVV